MPVRESALFLRRGHRSFKIDEWGKRFQSDIPMLHRAAQRRHGGLRELFFAPLCVTSEPVRDFCLGV